MMRCSSISSVGSSTEGWLLSAGDRAPARRGDARGGVAGLTVGDPFIPREVGHASETCSDFWGGERDFVLEPVDRS